MKKIIYPFIILLLSFSSTLLKGEDLQCTKSDSLSIIPLLRAPLLDRGIDSYSFIASKSIVGGITFSYFDFDSRDSKFLFNIIDNVNYGVNILRVSPYIGYSFKENQVVGMKVNYSKVNLSLGKMDINISNTPLSIGDIKFNQNLYGVSLFYRSYVGLDEDHRFGLFSEISISSVSGYANYIKGNDNKSNIYNTKILMFDIGMSPGIAVFIAQNVCMELSFNVVGFTYNRYKQSLNGEYQGMLERSGANFKINPINMNIGLTLCI